MDTDSSGAQRPWALYAALAFMAAGLIALLYVLFAASSKPEQTSGLVRFARGEMADLAIVDAPPPLPGRPIQNAERAGVSLRDYTGQVLVVNLWATWCAPCVEEMPTLAALQRRFGDRIRVVAVSIDGEAKREEAQATLARLTNNTLPFLIDISRGVMFDLGAGVMPLTVLYDAEGRERARLAGGADWGGDDAAAVIEALLAEES